MRCNKCSKIIPPHEEHVEYGSHYSEGGHFCEECWQRKQEWTVGDYIMWGVMIALLAFCVYAIVWMWRDSRSKDN